MTEPVTSTSRQRRARISPRRRLVNAARPLRPGVTQRRGVAVAIVLAVAQVLGRRIGERRAAAANDPQRPTPRLVQQLAQCVLGRALGEVASGGPVTTALRRFQDISACAAEPSNRKNPRSAGVSPCAREDSNL